MRPLKPFGEFLETGTVRKRAPDTARARSLIEEAEKRRRFLNEMLDKIGITDNNSNYFIETSYDVLLELLRAKLLVDGFYASGEGAHEAEVAYMRDLKFSEKDVRFMNDLRYYRNRILYYGNDFDAEYGKKIIKFLESIYPKLKSFLKDA